MRMGKAKDLGFSKDRLQRIDRFLAEKYVEPGRLPYAQFVGRLISEQRERPLERPANRVAAGL